MDVQQEQTAAAPVGPVAPCAGALPPPEQVRQALALLAAAQRPLLVAGSGAYYAGAEAELAAFAAAYAVPVVVPIWDRGAIPSPCPEFMGVVGAASGDPCILEDADLLLLLGAQLDYRVGYGRGPAGPRVVRVGMDPAGLAPGAADLDLLAGPKAALRALDEAAASRQLPGYESWLAAARQRRDRFAADVRAAARREDRRLHALDIMDALAEALPDETILIVDGGNVGQWFHQTLGRRRYPGHWLTCGASGVVGFGVGGAMAARAGYPRRPVVLVSGDGAATFNLTDLERAASQGLPFVMVIADDQSWGIVETGQLARYGAALSSRLGPIDFAALADSLGAVGTRADSAEQLRRALQLGLAQRRPTVVHVPISGGTPSAAS